MWNPWNALVRLILKPKTVHSLTLRPQERGPVGGCPRNDHHPRGFLGTTDLPGGVGCCCCSIFASCDPVLYPRPLHSPWKPSYPVCSEVSSAQHLHRPAALPLPSVSAGPERADCANDDWALPGCPPQGWAPHACLTTSCANVVSPPHLGVGCSFHLLVRRDHCPPFPPSLSGVLCPHLSVCSSVIP